ncbi:MAG: glutathione peroxidase [Bacteroidetes bacterium]|nr:glutathione peroxidase [Bacteroidota bacterium]
MNDINGKPVDLAKYKGHVTLIVNVASFCGYTKQYSGLESLYRSYKDRGFVVLGFPANDFGAQEPGTDVEIAQFCQTKYDVTFPMFSKITVKGEGKAPLYGMLTSGLGNSALAGEIGWNFEKFLIGKDGQIIKRYKSTVEPSSEELRADIEAALK